MEKRALSQVLAVVLAVAGGIVILVALTQLQWYSYGLETPALSLDLDISIDAWEDAGFLGTLANVLAAVAAVVGALSAVAYTLAGDSQQKMAGICFKAGLVTVTVVMLRMLFRPYASLAPTNGVNYALVGAVMIALGGWLLLRAERIGEPPA